MNNNNGESEKRDSLNEIKAKEKFYENNHKLTILEKNENLMKKKKKLTNTSDPSLLEADILNESYSEVSNSQIIQETIENLMHLFAEEENIISKIIEFSYEANNIERSRDLFDALYYEFKIRYQNKKLALKQLKDKEEQNFEYIKSIENNLKKTQNELIALKKQQETKQFHHSGRLKLKTTNEEFKDLDLYDIIIDIDAISNIFKEGWTMHINSLFYQKFFQSIAISLSKSEENNSNFQETLLFPNKIVSFLGLYDKGKTFILNSLINTSLPSEKKVQSHGISFKQISNENEVPFLYIDTVGAYSPIEIIDENSVQEKELTEALILDVVFAISEYFICVINEFKAFDQRYLSKLAKMLNKHCSNKQFKQLIVVHNFKEIENQEILDHLWETQAPKFFGKGVFMKSKVAAVNPMTGKSQEKHVHWFHTACSRHVRLANEDSMLGNSLNPWSLALIKSWLLNDHLEKDHKLSFGDLLKILVEKLTDVLQREETELQIENTKEYLVKKIKYLPKIPDNANLKGTSLEENNEEFDEEKKLID